MELLKEAADFFQDLGKANSRALLDKGNRGKVKEFCKTLVSKSPHSLPTKINIGNRIYELLSFMREGGIKLEGREMSKRVAEMDADLGREGAEYLLENQQDIPVALRGEIMFIFVKYFDFDDSPTKFCCVFWRKDRWVKNWRSFYSDRWNGRCRVVRRIK